MGRVVAALHETLDQRVAIKFLLPEALKNPEAVQRFLREARASVKLKSEHVGRVIDVGTLEDGAPYIVMEYLEGRDLAGELASRGPAPPEVAVEYVLQACEAIAEAHALGIVHRDLKPANLFLTWKADGSPLIKVLDFGISKAAEGDPSLGMTRTHTVMGSPGYASPEQLRSSRDVDARTDLWSLGVVLYELLSGRAPFQAESFSDLCIRVATEPAPPLSTPGVPPGLEEAVGRCLQKDPRARFANVAELAAALEPFGPAWRQGTAARIARVLEVPTAAAPAVPAPNAGTPTTLSGAAGEGEPGRGQGRGRALVGAGVVALAAVVGAGIALTRLGGDETTAARSAALADASPSAVQLSVADAAPLASIGQDSGAEGAAAGPPDAALEDLSLVARAERAARAAEFEEALRLCRAALAEQPDSQEATLVCAIASCNLEDRRRAKHFTRKITSSSRRSMVRQICLRSGVNLRDRRGGRGGKGRTGRDKEEKTSGGSGLDFDVRR